MRLFVAIDLSDPARNALEKVAGALPFGRPVDAGNLHLTLAFLGARSPAEAEAAHQALAEVAFAPFRIQPAGLGTFGAPDLVWAGLRDAAPVAALAARVRSALHGAGLPLPRERFRPHVTLARFDGAVDAGRLAVFLSRWEGFTCPPVPVEHFSLFRSTPTKHGPVYEALADYPAA